MKCPECNSTLLMTERLGVEIDYCPECRGVWLNKGELDKLLEKAAAEDTASSGNRQQQQYKDWDDDDDDHDDGYFQGNKKRQQQGKRKGGFLGNFFDFD